MERCVVWLAPLLRQLDDGLVTLCDCDGDDVCVACEPVGSAADTPGRTLR